MLPPKLHGGLAATRSRSWSAPSILLHQAAASTAIRASATGSQSRFFWHWHRARDWSSPQDQSYYRLQRFHTLKSRAKLLEKLRRRGKFEWDHQQRPFFTPRHVREASHWNGRPLTRGQSKSKQAEEEAAVEEEQGNGVELSRREKEWKLQMEAMRRRIEQDPYEAIFGKRFEPFWSPLVPTWMREEMGLRNLPNLVLKTTPKTGVSENIHPRQETKTEKPAKVAMVKQDAVLPAKEESGGQTSSYSYSSSTSWDSWTNKTRTTEWDSISGKTKRFEYDPISNRMVQIHAPRTSEAVVSEPVDAPPVEKTIKPSGDMQSLVNTPPSQQSGRKAIEVPTTKLTELRKSIPVVVQAPKGPIGFGFPVTLSTESKNTVQTPIKSTPVALGKPSKSDVDLLTADDVRAEMGKTKEPAPVPPIPLEQSSTKKQPDTKIDINNAAELQSSEYSQGGRAISSEWDKAELSDIYQVELDGLLVRKAKLIKGELGLLHIERLKRELAKMDHRIREVRAKIAKVDGQQTVTAPSEAGDGGLTKKGVSPARASTPSASPPQTALDRAISARNTSALQPAVERMQKKEELVELDDAAAHESIEPLESASGVPKDWSKQADLLQADRVARTAGKQPFPIMRWVDSMRARIATNEAALLRDQAPTAKQMEAQAKLEKTNAILENEVKDQKLRMQAHEGKYAQKIKGLRGELETAYKQSAVHSEKHVERIRFLEAQVSKGHKASESGGSVESAETDSEAFRAMRGEGDFCTNVTNFANSPKWYKQAAAEPGSSSQEAEVSAHKVQDRALVREVRDIYEKQYGVIDTKHRQGDPPTPLPESAKAVQVVEVESNVDLGDALAEHEKEQQQSRAKDVEEKRNATAAKFGIPVEELLRYEYKRDDALEDRIAKEEIAMRQPQTVPENEKDWYTFKPDPVLEAWCARNSNPLIRDWVPEPLESLQHEGKQLADDEVALQEEAVPAIANEPPQNDVEPSEEVAEQQPANMESSVQWTDPPLYKVLAYDSGNDTFSTATTTSNFSGAEAPISIPQALSQLYQPARFVSHFAELQQDGYQVIYGTRDLLVFKKVKATEAAAFEEVKQDSSGVVGTAHHGLVKPRENAVAEEAANYYASMPGQVEKPYDPTSIENGKLMPYENALAQEAAQYYDNAARSRASVNPVDGTTKSHHTNVEALSGNLSSATEPSMPSRHSAEQEQLENFPLHAEDVDAVHAPRVRREEHIFTGTRRKWNHHHGRHERSQTLRRRSDEARERFRRKRRRGGALKWALSVGAGAAALTYVVGVAAEASRSERKRRGREERWEQILEGRRGRWE